MINIYSIFPSLPKKSWIKSDSKTHYTYEGFGKDRINIFNSSFVINSIKAIHLGLDIYVPANQSVASLTDGIVVHTMYDSIPIDDSIPFDDKNNFLPWKGRVIIMDPLTNYYYLYGQLKEPKLIVGNIIAKGSIVGYISENKNPHLHLQIMKESYISQFENYEDISGYDFECLPIDIINPELLISFV